MANVVDFVMQITAGKSPVNIRKIADELSKLKSKLGDVQEKSKVSFKKFGQSAKKAKAKVKGLSLGLAGVTAVAGGVVASFIKMNQVIADSTNEIVDASTRSGIAAETLAGLRLAAEGSGKSFSSLERGLDQFSTRMLDTSRGTGEAKKTFDSLGISVIDAQGNLRDTNSVFMETIKKLGQMTNATKRNADINKLFGRSGMTLIQSGAIEDLDKFIGKAKELGPAFDENGIEKAAQFQRGMADFKTASLGAIGSIAEGLTGEKGLGPSLTTLGEDLSNFGGGMKIFLEEMRNAFGGLKIFLADLEPEIEKATASLKEFMTISPETIENVFQVKVRSGAAAELEEQGAIQTETPFESLMDEARTKGGQDKAVIKKLIKQLISEANTFKEIVKEQKDGNIEVNEILEFLMKESNLSAIEIRDQFNALNKQIQTNRKNRMERSISSLTKKIASGQIKDFKAIQGQLLNLRGRMRKAGEDLKKIDRLIADFRKLQKGKNKKDKSSFGKFSFSVSESTKNATQDVEQFFAFIEEQEDPFGLNNIEAEDPLSIIKNLEKLDQIKNSILNISEEKKPFQDVENQILNLKDKFLKLGMSTIEIENLINEIEKLREELQKTAKLDFALKISADVVGLAGGDIQGFLSSIFEKTLKGQQLQTANLALGLSGAIASLGEQFVMAGDQAIDEENARREQRNIALMEKAFGRSLSEQEKQNVKNRIKLSEKEERAIREQAAKDKVAEDVERFSLAIKTGLQVLPSILFEVLPPLFLQLAQDIVQAIIELPFRIGAAILDGIKSLFTAIVEGPKRFFEGIGSFFSDLFDGKRTGGRFVSARRGMRFTGAQDGLAMLHRNEYVVPESGARPQAVERIMNQQNGGGMVININADVVDRDAVETLVRKIEQRFQSFGQFQSTLFAG